VAHRAADAPAGRPRGVDVLSAQDVVGFQYCLSFGVGRKIAEGGPALESCREAGERSHNGDNLRAHGDGIEREDLEKQHRG